MAPWREFFALTRAKSGGVAPYSPVRRRGDPRDPAARTHAIGYTWEADLHLWMERVWSLSAASGDTETHGQRCEHALFPD